MFSEVHVLNYFLIERHKMLTPCDPGLFIFAVIFRQELVISRTATINSAKINRHVQNAYYILHKEYCINCDLNSNLQ